MITIRKWNSKTFSFATDSEEDKVDMCIYDKPSGEKLCTLKAETKKNENGETEHHITIDEDVSKELGQWEHDYAFRINGDPFEEDTLKIHTHAEKDDN